MASFLRLPHGLVRRHLSLIERALTAAALAFILYRLLVSLPAYPSPWEVAIATAVFVVTLWSPPVAFFLAVLAAAYPLYTLSLYLAVLFLAVALLGQRVFINNLGAALLVLAVPWLARANLAWLLPLLGGLWWGKSGGAWMGGLAALWGQLLFGMMGRSPDWLLILGSRPAFDQIAGRFAPANSLETLLLIVSPLAPDATLLLYHLLQIVLWAMTAGLLGGLAERAWFQQRRPVGNILLGAAGVTLLAVGHFALAFWLGQVTLEGAAALVSLLALNALLPVLALAVLESVRDLVEHPLPAIRLRPELSGRARPPAIPPRKAPVGPTWARFLQTHSAPQNQSEAPHAGAPSTEYPPLPIPEDLPKSGQNKKNQNDDLIKIELD